MRHHAVFGLVLLLAGCVPPAGDTLRREALAPQPAELSAPSALAAPPRSSSLYGGGPPPLPTPKPISAQTASPQSGAPAGSAAPASVDQPIVVPNGNGTTTIIHADGRIETVPTPK
jgi:hypothetical protein